MTPPPLVIDLSAAGATMLATAGGKAANLGEMIRAGLPVPPGFCVTTEAYSLVAASVSIDFGAFQGAGTEELKKLAGAARAALRRAGVPPEVEAAILEAYGRLGNQTPVAVRSSATAEDLPNASFAGQQDTYLNISGPQAVLEAVRRCWASLWTDRAVVYRATNAIPQHAVRLAVVVQRMVEAATAGVLFTANPVTGKRRQAVIDASPGLGEAVVSGSVNPDRFTVETASGDILERRLGDKRFEVRSRAAGGTELVEKAGSAETACVTDQQVRDLADLGARVEAYFGQPQDIEWAIDAEGSLWLTQSRPITTLFPIPAHPGQPAPEPGEFHVYFCFSVAQGLYRPLTPMGLATFRLMSASACRMLGFPADDPHHGSWSYAEAGQRVFIDLTNTLRGRAGRTLLPRVLDVMEARSAAILRRLFSDPRLPETRSSWGPLARRVLRVAARYGVPLRMIEGIVSPAAARARAGRVGAELAAKLAVPADATPVQRLDFIERLILTELAPLAPRTLPAAGAGFAMLAAAAKLLGEDARPDDLQSVLRGAPHNLTTEMDLALWRAAKAIKKDAAAAQIIREKPAEELVRLYRGAALPAAAHKELAGFLSRFGHRAVAEVDLGMPRWSDDPTHILGVIRNYLRLENPEQAPDAVFARGAAEAEAMIETLAARARKRGRLRAAAVRFALKRARELAGLRESPKYYLIAAFAAIRRILAKTGAELARAGRLENADDLFFLDLVEARQAVNGADLRARAAARRQDYEDELRRRRVPNVVLSDGTAPDTGQPAQAGEGKLAGTPASAGTVTGIARVVLEPAGAQLEPGEILVAPSTDPGWTPLFLTAGGLVMEMGGANSHGAVVAREYGIPAVVGVPEATQRIRTGQRITVDGGAGTVKVEE